MQQRNQVKPHEKMILEIWDIANQCDHFDAWVAASEQLFGAKTYAMYLNDEDAAEDLSEASYLAMYRSFSAPLIREAA